MISVGRHVSLRARAVGAVPLAAVLASLSLCASAGAASTGAVSMRDDGLVSPLIDGTKVSGLAATASATAAGATEVVYEATFKVANALPAGTGYIRLEAPAGAAFSTDDYSYEVTDETSSAKAQTSHVEVDPDDMGENVVDVYIPDSAGNTISIAAGDTVKVEAYGASNPSTPSNPSIPSTEEFFVSTSADTEPVSTPFPIGPATSVSDLSASANTTSAGASEVVYSATFKATEGLSNGGGEEYFGDDEKPGRIRLVAPAGVVFGSDGDSYEVSDQREERQAIHVKVDPESKGETNVVEVDVPPFFADNVPAGETVTIEAYGTKNPVSEAPAGQLSVSTTSDVTPVSTPLPIGPETEVGEASVGSLGGAYTVRFATRSNVSDGDWEQFGDDEQPGYVQVSAPGATMPSNAGDYTFTVTSVQHGVQEFGVLHVEASGETVKVKPRQTVEAGALVTLQIAGVTGSPTASALISTSSDTKPVSAGAIELAPLSGTVTFAGAAVADATVQACPVPAGRCQTTSTETAGAFTLAVPAVAGTRYALTANPPGATSHAGQGSLAPVVLGAGATGATSLAIALPAAPGIAAGVSILTGGGSVQTSTTANPFVPWASPYELSLEPSFFPKASRILVTKVVVRGTNIDTGEPEQQVVDAGGSIGGLPTGLELGSGPLTIDMPSDYPMHGEVGTTIDYRIEHGHRARVAGVANTNVLDETYPASGSPATDPLAAYLLNYGNPGGISVGTARIVGPDAKYFQIVPLGSVGSPRTTTDCGSSAAELSQYGGSGTPPADTECGIAVRFTPPTEAEEKAHRIYYRAKLRVATGVAGASTIPVALLGCDARVAQATGSTCYGSSGAGVGEKASAEVPFDPASLLKQLQKEIEELEKEEKECLIYSAGHLVAKHREPCLADVHEEAGGGEVEIEEEEEEGEEEGAGGESYHDPSGVLYAQTAEGPVPLAGATVTLKQSFDEAGPFAAVPNGSPVMSPANRTNPGTTNADGMFGWDVLAGFYEIEAAKSGCDPATTPVLVVPPPVDNLTLTLTCTSLPSRSAPSASVSSSAPSTDYGQPVTFTAKIGGGASPTGTVTFDDGGTSIGEGVLQNGEATLQLSTLTPGEHSITVSYSGDGANKPATSAAIVQTVKSAGAEQPGQEEQKQGGSTATTTTTTTSNAEIPPAKIPPAGRVTLLGAKLAVSRTHRAAVKLSCTGQGACAGTLKLVIQEKVKHGKHQRVKHETIATGSFSIAAGKTGTVELALNPAGEALLGKAHGRLRASLTLSVLTASLPQTRTTSVLLVRQKPKPKRR